MDSEDILALYDWDTGVCFRHPEAKTETTVIKTLHPRQGSREELRACRSCILAMEAARRAAAEGAGVPYAPGRAGEGVE